MFNTIETARLILRPWHADDLEELDRIISVTAPWNAAARRVMERIGLEYQGSRQWKGVEVVWYAIDRSAWQARGRR